MPKRVSKITGDPPPRPSRPPTDRLAITLHREGGLREACSKRGSPEDPLGLEGGLDLGGGGPFVMSGTSGYPLNLKIFL
jgi:hypothetical protein